MAKIKITNSILDNDCNRFNFFHLPLLSIILVVAFIIFISNFQIVYATNETQLTYNQGGIYFTGSSSDPKTYYQDAISGNLDVGLRLCDYGARFVGGFYALNVSGTFINQLVTYQSSSQALSFTDIVDGGGCFQTTPGFFTISPSQLVTPSPNVYKAAFPGYLWTGYDVTANPGTVSTFVLGGNDSYLRGNYTVTRAFDYLTQEVTIQTPTIQFQTLSETISKSASDASFGISSSRPMIIGICEDSYGALCSNGSVFLASSFPSTFLTDLTPAQVNDQNIYTRYLVLNGIGLPMCIGANLQASISGVSPSPSYFSQNITFTIQIRNNLNSPYELMGGNVPVTTPFKINLLIYNQSNSSIIIYNVTYPTLVTLLPGQITFVNLQFPAYALSGQYTVVATVDPDYLISECNEVDNSGSLSFTLHPIVTPRIQIDGVTTTVFPYANIPYWVNYSITNSDNATLNNATLQMVEENGLLLNVGTQLWNQSTNDSGVSYNTGISTKSISQFKTNYGGTASITYLPTYNQLYDPQYGYLNTSEHIGNSSLYLTGNVSDGSQFIFIVDGVVTSQYPLTIGNYTYNGTVTQKNVLNNLTMAQTFDNIYRAFANFVKSLVG